MTDYIKKAVELAEGWGFPSESQFLPGSPPIAESPSGYMGAIEATPELLDALAAQLVRQVEGAGYGVCIQYGCVDLTKDMQVESTWSGGPDRTMNTIKAIVDSSVLE